MAKRFTRTQRRLITAGSIVVLAGAAFGLFLILHHRPTSSISPTTPVNPTSSLIPNHSSTAKGSGSSSGETSKQSSPSTTAAGSGLAPPQGQASHTIVSKSAGDQAENSPNLEVTCLTSSSNNCFVRLTSPHGQVSVITNTYNDKQGNFIFDWSAKSYETGTWKMELVASRGGQEASTNIGPLEVMP